MQSSPSMLHLSFRAFTRVQDCDWFTVSLPIPFLQTNNGLKPQPWFNNLVTKVHLKADKEIYIIYSVHIACCLSSRPSWLWLTIVLLAMKTDNLYLINVLWYHLESWIWNPARLPRELMFINIRVSWFKPRVQYGNTGRSNSVITQSVRLLPKIQRQDLSRPKNVQWH